jgi:MFS family permease
MRRIPDGDEPATGNDVGPASPLVGPHGSADLTSRGSTAMSGDKAPSGRNAWIAPLLMMLLLQTTSAFLNQFLATMAPVLGPEFGWSQNAVGYLVATGMAGSIAFLMCGSPLVHGVGPIRAVQIGLGLGAFGIALLPLPLSVAPFMASLLIGLAYGPATPAGSDVLQRYAPARHRSLIFSIKQAGVPLGGAAAGLILPSIAAAAGWRAALVFAAGAVVATVAVAQTVRGRIDAGRDGARHLRLERFFSVENIRRPFAALWAGRQLPRLSVAGACLAMNQGAWNAFFVTYLVSGLGLSVQRAGAIFAIMQASGIAGRILLGWVSDRIGSGVVAVRMVAATSALTSVVIAGSSPDWPFWLLALLAAAAGLTVYGWNGVQLAEIARRAPRHLVGEASAGGTVLVFLGFTAGPTIFASILALTGRFDWAYLTVAVLPAFAFLLLVRISSDPPDPMGSS